MNAQAHSGDGDSGDLPIPDLVVDKGGSGDLGGVVHRGAEKDPRLPEVQLQHQFGKEGIDHRGQQPEDRDRADGMGGFLLLGADGRSGGYDGAHPADGRAGRNQGSQPQQLDHTVFEPRFKYLWELYDVPSHPSEDDGQEEGRYR